MKLKKKAIDLSFISSLLIFLSSIFYTSIKVIARRLIVSLVGHKVDRLGDDGLWISDQKEEGQTELCRTFLITKGRKIICKMLSPNRRSAPCP